MVLRLSQLHALSIDLDLRAFPSYEPYGPVRTVSHQVASLVEPSLNREREAAAPWRWRNEDLGRLVGLVQISPSHPRAFEEEFADTADRSESSRIGGV
jgi:hypothetical protein